MGTTSVASADPTQAGGPGRIDWRPCPEPAEVECGTLSLPIDWAKPRGERFDLAAARRKATDPAGRIGVPVVNPGGPGGSGVDFALGADGYFSPQVRQRFDIVGFDPRGVARSQAVRCSVEVLRTALGERRINYYGLSCGTLMGRQYAEEFGRHVRAMVIDSNVDHSLGTWRFNETEAATAEDSFREFVAWCDRTESCALHGRDVAVVWDDLPARADRGEVAEPFDPSREVTADDIIGSAFSAFYGPDWQQLSDFLVELGAGAPAKAAFAEETARNPFPAARAAHRGSSLGHRATAGCVGLPERVDNPRHRLEVEHAPEILMLNALHDPATGHGWAVNAHRQSRDTTVLLTYEG